MISKSKLLAFSLIPTLAVGALLGLGFLLGRYTVLRHFDTEMKNAFQASFLGNILTEKQKKEIIHAYHEGEKVLPKLDEITWSIPNMPTPFVGTAPMPGLHGNTHINSMQFRAVKEVAMPKPVDTFRIFITGGSAAYGSGAPSDDRTIAGYLNQILSERLLPSGRLEYEVFTMANPAWASTHERIIIENRLSELEPDMIISFSGCNDVHWGKMGRNVLWFRPYFDEFFLRLIKRAYRITGGPEMPEITEIEDAAIPPSVVTRRLLKNVRLSSFILSEGGSEYLFMLQPTLNVTGKHLTDREKEFLIDPEYFRECYAQIDKALQAFHWKNFQYVNLSDVFNDMNDNEDIFLDSYHFGDKGNEIIAENIFAHIKERLYQTDPAVRDTLNGE